MLKSGDDDKLKQAAFFIRREVFVKEQGIPENLEFDETPQKNYTYLVYYWQEQPVATLRYDVENQRLHLDRLAVLKSFRKQGLGKKLVLTAEKMARKIGITESFLSGETLAKNFYEKLGYKISGKEFLEDGVPCFLFTKKWS